MVTVYTAAASSQRCGECRPPAGRRSGALARLVIVVVLSAGVAAWSLACSVASAPAAPPEVLVAEAALGDAAVPSEWSATLDAPSTPGFGRR
jgi:hypothetical protein